MKLNVDCKDTDILFTQCHSTVHQLPIPEYQCCNTPRKTPDFNSPLTPRPQIFHNKPREPKHWFDHIRSSVSRQRPSILPVALEGGGKLVCKFSNRRNTFGIDFWRVDSVIKRLVRVALSGVERIPRSFRSFSVISPLVNKNPCKNRRLSSCMQSIQRE